MKRVFAPRWLFEKTSGITRFVIEMAFTALASDYKDFAAEGYRWVKIDGPFMCPAKEDLREITRDPSGIDKLHMVEKPRAYYLIQGALRYSMMNLTTS